MFSRVKGTRDLIDLTLFNYIVNQAKSQLKSYNFIEIKTPILEHVDLFKRSLGLHTDVVTKEMFTLEVGPEGKKETLVLRPEATAATVRAFINAGIQNLPWKVFSVGPMFRHERPQKGRYRQFYQINMEVIGSVSISQDAHMIAMLDRLFTDKLHLNNYAILINFLGCPEDRKKFRDILYKFLTKNSDQICATCQDRKEKNIMRVFDCKNPACQELYQKAPYIIDSLCDPCKKEWQQLQDELQILSISAIVKPTLVRGLDYYNKTVFEFSSDDLGAQSAFCGGGRYDQLVTMLGGKVDQPSIGAAIGIDRVILLLEQKLDQLKLTQEQSLYVIIPMTEMQHAVALFIADMLIAKGVKVDILLEGSLKSMMRKANKMGAKSAIMIGEDEQQVNEVTIKNMVTSEQARIKQIDLVEYLKQ